jgi:phosphoribosylanthranilate isomerase
MTAVKICGLTNLADARLAWRCGADLLGFVFVATSPRCVLPETAARVTRELREEGCAARLVGVFVDEEAAYVQDVAALCGLDHVQLHGHESPDYVAKLGLSAIVARRVRDRIPWDELGAYDAWACLCDAYDPARLGGSGRRWEWGLAADGAERPRRLILAGGLTPQNVLEAIRAARPWGVDVSSGVETAPGRKDPAKVQHFCRLAKGIGHD